MQAIRAKNTPATPNSTSKVLIAVIIVSIFIIIALYINNAISAFQVSSQSNGTTVLSQKSLEEKYGLRVNLIAVTAAGGFVDVRLKITDGDKLKQLLADKNNFPTLSTQQGIILNAPSDLQSQEIKFITGGNLFIIYPNASNAVHANEPVTLSFGDIVTEPIIVK